jgi:hypothetical protein
MVADCFSRRSALTQSPHYLFGDHYRRAGGNPSNATTQFGAGAGIPRPIAPIIDLAWKTRPHITKPIIFSNAIRDHERIRLQSQQRLVSLPISQFTGFEMPS